VGQKTHPTGFRIGINKSHNAIWFANYNAYNEILKEDDKIRKLFQKQTERIYGNAGITKLEIQRKVNQLELVVHAARPIVIVREVEQNDLIVKLRSRLKTLICNSEHIRMKVSQIAKSEQESALVAMSIADQLEKRVAFRKTIRQITEMLRKRGVKGFKIQISGRLNGAEIARAEWVREGRVPLQTIRADISYATHRANTIYGVLGIKV
jgi:small subunit ribosomal protein S3|tara:strand:- start:3347 stop:3973 length:627 start_codon:yes stop_codon:yes gene_type:complete